MEKFILNKNLFFVEEKNGYVVIEQKSASLDTWVYRNGKVFQHGSGASMNDDCIIATINFKIPGIPYALVPDYEADKINKAWEYYNRNEDFGVVDSMHYVSGYLEAKKTFKYDDGFLIKLWGLAKMGYSYEKAMKELTKPKLIKSIEFETKVTSEQLIGMCGDNEIWDGVEEFIYETIPYDVDHKAGKLIIKKISYVE